MQTAAIYLRSSKDRHEVSLPSQRRKLMELAEAKGLVVVEEFSDAVESGKDENRPAFQSLLKRLKDRDRPWSHLLALDTSRIARNAYLAKAVEYDCDKRGIKLIYHQLPETNPITDLLTRNIFYALDQVWSMQSKEKGLAGMSENVRQGFRAGGRAPYGFRLVRIATGAVRDGQPVTKSKLEPDAAAPAIAAYLKLRAGDTPRAAAARQAGVDLAATTLIGIEWNALTYAGHTVWNVHAEVLADGSYRGGVKRRPRADWQIEYDTHAALISTPEAEAILARMGQGPKRTRSRVTDYLLTGLLRTPDGAQWHADSDGRYRAYRAAGKRIAGERVETAVVGKISQDLQADRFVDALVKEARRVSAPADQGEEKRLKREIRQLEADVAKWADLAAQCAAPRPFLERIAKAEATRAKLQVEHERLSAERGSAEVLRALGPNEIRSLLGNLARNLEGLDRPALKDALRDVVDGVVLDPQDMTCRIHYRIETGDKLASPRGFEPRFTP